MAKAKKSEADKGDTKAAAEKKAPAAKKAPGKKPAAKGGAAPALVGRPLIDTNLAAANAARMLAAKFPSSAGNASQNAPAQESAMFKNLKAGVNKPASAGMSNLLEKSHGPTEPVKSHHQQKQVGRNQTFGADVARTGVPRRTPG
jgi:hypothetical protein